MINSYLARKTKYENWLKATFYNFDLFWKNAIKYNFPLVVQFDSLADKTWLVLHFEHDMSKKNFW